MSGAASSIRPIAILTDFGSRDAYAGIVRGVIHRHCPGATIVDLTHEVPPFDVRWGALALCGAVDFLPENTIYLAVVDPGVGGGRRALCLSSSGRLFVGPDNGLLWPAATALGQPEARRIDWRGERGELSATFHARDLFAPAAAALARGLPPEQLGPIICDPIGLEIPRPVKHADSLVGCILMVDHYGNAITNLRPSDLAQSDAAALDGVAFTVGEHTIPLIGGSYSSVVVGEALALVGSHGYFELALNQGNAADRLGLRADDPVQLTFKFTGAPAAL
jgi:S-adenosylmethionine hydrolase